MNTRSEFKYWAFLSYSHTDARWSDWLHRKLETYRIPRRLVGRTTERGYKVPKRLHPVFRDREELPSSSDLSENIETALRESRYLIVICSPRSAASLWVNQEIKTFKSLDGEKRILSLIIEGEPNATDKPSIGMPEAFPEALRYRVNARGELTSQRVEPIAADARPGRDGRASALLKILAGLLGVGFDELKRRERARRIRRRMAWSSATAALMAVALLGWQWQESRRAEALRVEQSLSDFSEGTDRLARHDVQVGPLYLARALRSNPTLPGPALRIADLLRRHRFALPVGRRLVHSEEILVVEYSPDGAGIITASHDGTARIWDAVSGEAVTSSMVHESTVHGVHFSPDGKRVLTVSGWHISPGAVVIWDAETGTPRTAPMRHDEFISAAEFSPDGRRVLSASVDSTARVWDAETGRLLLPPLEHPHYVGSARFGPEGRKIATGCADGIVRIWEASTGRLLLQTPSHRAPLRSVWFSTDGGMVLAQTDHTLRTWDSRSGAEARPPLTNVAKIFSAAYHDRSGYLVLAESETVVQVRNNRTGTPLGPRLTHPNEVELARLSPDGALLVTASGDGLVRIWDTSSGRLAVEPVQPEGEIEAVHWSPDGSSILVASGIRNKGGWARVWFVATGSEPNAPPTIEKGGYLARFSPDGQVIVTAGGSNQEGKVSVWQRPTLEPLMGPVRVRGRVQTIEFSPDGKEILVATGYCGQAGAVHVFNATSGEASVPPIEHLNGAHAARFSPDGDRIVSASCGQTARVWDAQTGTGLTEYLQHGDRVNTVEFSPDGARILATSGAPAAGPVYNIASRGAVPQTQSRVDAAWVWDATTGALILGPLLFPNSVRTARFSRDGRLFATACGSQFRGGSSFAQVWDASSGRPISAEMPLEGTAEWVEFSPDGERVLTAHSESASRGAAAVWDARTGEILTQPMVHGGAVRSARFSPDASWIVTASSDSTARIWDGHSGQPITEPWLHDSPVDEAQFSPDGLSVVTSTRSQSVSVWDVSLPSRNGSFLYLADLMEAVIGSQLTTQGTIAPAKRTLNEALGGPSVVADLFPFQFASWSEQRRKYAESASRRAATSRR